MDFKNRCANWRSGSAKSYSAVFAGDICLRSAGLEFALAGGVPEIFKSVKPFFDSADLRIVQWETTLTESQTPIDKCGPNLKNPPCCVNIPQFLGADAALLANNHIGDFGPGATMETIAHLQAAGIRTVGAGANGAAARAGLALKCGDVPVTLINRAENEFGGARDDRAGVATLAILRDLDAIRVAKAAGGLVFVALHGGHETNPFPSPRMVELFRAFIDAGADLVWNCHTHCPEGVELSHGKPIVYSPGNFFFPTSSPKDALPTWWGGYLVKFRFDADGVFGLEVLPYQQHLTGIDLLSPEREEKFFAYLAELSAPLADPAALQHCFDIWCSGSGLNHLHGYAALDPAWEPDWRNRDTVKRYLGPRNLNTCESHHDMVRRTLMLIERYEITALKDEQPKVRALQSPDWIEKRY